MTRVSDETKASLPAVAWKELIAVRVVLAHADHRVDLDLLWGIAADDLPQVASKTRPLGRVAEDEQEITRRTALVDSPPRPLGLEPRGSRPTGCPVPAGCPPGNRTRRQAEDLTSAAPSHDEGTRQSCNTEVRLGKGSRSSTSPKVRALRRRI